jgi:peptide/nickel transport system permease protein
MSRSTDRLAPPTLSSSRAWRLGVLGDSSSLRRFTRNRLALLGLAIVVGFALVGLFAPAIAPHEALAMSLGDGFLPPGPEHPLGTDDLGRDVLSRLMHAARYDLGLALVTVLLAGLAGVVAGALAAFFGGALDAVLMRFVDVLLAFPAFMLGLALVAFLGPSLANVVLVLATTHFPRYARLIRGSVLSVQRREYVEAARVIGAAAPTLIVRHILPNSVAPVVVYASLDMGVMITSLAGLSFLGVGIQPPNPEWGLMLSSARNNLVFAPWTAFFPGLAISLTVIGFNFVGDGLRDALDPRLLR